MKNQTVRTLKTAAAAIALAIAASAPLPAMDAEPYLLLAKDIRGQLLKASWRSAYASGDFNGDHFPDLAIGVPWGMASNLRAGGKVLVLYGDADGLPAMSEAVTTAMDC
jgi:hypothetical protein